MGKATEEVSNNTPAPWTLWVSIFENVVKSALTAVYTTKSKPYRYHFFFILNKYDSQYCVIWVEFKVFFAIS